MAATVTVLRQRSTSRPYRGAENAFAPADTPAATVEVDFTIEGDSSYPAGGYTVTAAQLGLRRIHEIYQVFAAGDPTNAYAIRQTWANRLAPQTTTKLTFNYDESTAEITSTTDVSGTAYQMMAVGEL